MDEKPKLKKIEVAIVIEQTYYLTVEAENSEDAIDKAEVIYDEKEGNLEGSPDIDHRIYALEVD